MHTLQIVLHSTIATAKSSKIQELIRLQKANTNHISKKVTYAIYDHLLFTLALHFIQQILPFPQQRIPNHQKQRERKRIGKSTTLLEVKRFTVQFTSLTVTSCTAPLSSMPS